MANKPWADDLFPPLDITATARHIANLWRHAVDSAEREARQEQERRRLMPELGGPDELRFTYTVLESQFGDGIIEALRAYDEGRTRHIEFLKSRLMEMDNLYPRPSIIIERKKEDGK